jgi:hypothetical protein
MKGTASASMRIRAPRKATPRSRFGIISGGKSWGDVLTALGLLKLEGQSARCRPAAAQAGHDLAAGPADRQPFRGRAGMHPGRRGEASIHRGAGQVDPVRRPGRREPGARGRQGPACGHESGRVRPAAAIGRAVTTNRRRCDCTAIRCDVRRSWNTSWE